MGTVIDALNTKMASHKKLNKVAKAKELLKAAGSDKLAACIKEVEQVCAKHNVKVAGIGEAIRGAAAKAKDLGGKAVGAVREAGGKAVGAVREAGGKAVEKGREMAVAHPGAAAGLGAAGLGAVGVGAGQLTGGLDQYINRKLHGEQVDTNPHFVGAMQRNLPAIESGILGAGGAALGAELASPGSLGTAASAVGGAASSGMLKAKALLARLRGVKV